MIVNWLVLALVVVLGGVFLALTGRMLNHRVRGGDSDKQVSSQASVSRRAVNRDLYLQRIREIEQEAAEGVLSDTALVDAKTELDKRFLDDTAGPEESTATGVHATNLWVPSLAIVVITLVVYFSGSSWRLQVQADEALLALPELGRKVLENDAEQPSREELDVFALGLRQKLAAAPDDAVAWLVYGRVMVAMNQTEQAMQAMAKSYALNPERMGTLLSYSQLLLSTGDDQYLRQAGRLLAEALAQQPTNIEALSLLGFVAYGQGDWQEAQQAWELLLAQLDEDDPRYAAVTNALADAKQRQQVGELALQVTVNLAAELIATVPDNATLFVYVRDPQTPNGPPAAVIRQPVTEFPITVTLTDNDAMLPDYQLSSLTQWQLAARISADERIDAQAGDLDAPPMVIEAAAEQRVTIEINQRNLE